jgi:Glycoside hydrolase family 44
MDFWWDYFYSKKDVESGWGTGPCYSPWSNPVDRYAHNGIPLIEYYLQQFKAYETAHNVRLLDYLDLHTYFAPDNLAFSTGGDTASQIARLDSTRVFWDPTYTDPNFLQPNYTSDANYSTSCTPPKQSPQVIPMMKTWVAKDYPGTKMAITEYNWGGLEHINGALAQADILGVFGREGLDLGTLWGPPDPATQVPGMMAFEVYRNYDGAGSTFGNEALPSTSGDQSKLSVYGALRTADNMVTIVVLNKTYGDLTDTLTLANLSPAGPAQVFLYSNAHLAGIVAQPNITVKPPVAGATTSTISATFPAQSITIFVVPKA